MVIVALGMALMGVLALLAALITGNAVIGWICVGAGAIGGLLLIVDALRARRRRAAQRAVGRADVLEFDADYPDERPAADAPSHGGDKEVQREILREERVIYSDNGPGNPDVTHEEVVEATRHRGRGHR